jgi:hypothetical protein
MDAVTSIKKRKLSQLFSARFTVGVRLTAEVQTLDRRNGRPPRADGANSGTDCQTIKNSLSEWGKKKENNDDSHKIAPFSINNYNDMQTALTLTSSCGQRWTYEYAICSKQH